jgi:hypothetical protein
LESGWRYFIARADQIGSYSFGAGNLIVEGTAITGREVTQRRRNAALEPGGVCPIRAAKALIKLEAREARLLGLDMPTRIEAAGKNGDALISVEAIGMLLARADAEEERRKEPAGVAQPVEQSAPDARVVSSSPAKVGTEWALQLRTPRT